MKNLNFHNIRLRNKILILYITSVFIPIVLTNIIFYNVTINNVKEQKIKDVTLALEQIQLEFLDSIENGVGISSSMYTDNKINEFLERDYSSPAVYIESYDSYLRGFNQYSINFSPIQAINFYTDNPTVVFSGGVNPISESISETDWFKSINAKEGTTPIVTRTGSGDVKDTFSIVQELDFFRGYDKTKKFVKIDIDVNTINHIFSNVNFQGYVYLLNEQSEIEYSSDPSIDWQEHLIDFQTIPLPKKATLLEKTYDLNNYLSNWKIVGVISEKELLEDVYSSRLFILYLACFNFLVPTLVIILISRSLNIRLNRILKYMKKMKNQRFETITGAEYDDEIGQLTTEFNRMSKKIEELINDVYVVNIQKKDLELRSKQAQLSALQSQINPHFLFNALETIRMRSIIKTENETAKIIQNMAKMLRNSFTWGKDWVSVNEEITIVMCFLEIQRYRFEDKLEFEIDIDKDAYDCIIPNMSLLPFVENASIHGIEPRKEKGKILIQIRSKKEHLECIISDNGPGISKEVLSQMLESLQTEEAIGEHVGIKNVYYRLKMYYGSDFYFHIESEKGIGTKIIIHLPSK